MSGLPAATGHGQQMAGRITLPAVDALLQQPGMQALVAEHGHTLVVRIIRERLAEHRARHAAGHPAPASAPGRDATARQAGAGAGSSPGGGVDWLAEVSAAIQARLAPRLRPVFNLSGTVLHTNLGRTQLPEPVVAAVAQALRAPCNLEFDLDSGGRGDRDDLVSGLLCELTGAEDVTIVNNNAAAVLLMLNSLARGREVIVSRGELVEIGGAFRIPDIMSRAGARLREVGTTNRTHPADYREAIGPRSALLMKVHASNYRVEGFVRSVPEQAVAEIARQAGLPLVVDLGSGSLVDFSRWGLPHETTVQQSLQAGADLVSFSGDKLLGGPQAGFIVGRRDLVARIKKNPLKRALRVGKLTLAAIEALLRLYLVPEQLQARLTTLRLLTRPQTDIQQQAQRVLPALQQGLGTEWQVMAMPMFSQIGSGALPVDLLPSHGCVIRRADGRRPGRHLKALAAALRQLPVPVIGRIADDALWLDLRCLAEAEEPVFVQQCGGLGLPPA